MSDYEAMQIHVFRDNMIQNRVQRRFETYGLMTMTGQSQHVRDMMAVEDPVVTSRAAEVYYEAAARNHLTLGAIERAVSGARPVRGRKSVVLVSEGFVYDTQLPEFKRILDATRRVNAVIYFVNSRGLEGLPDALTAEYSTVLPAEDLGFAFAQTMETTEGSVSLAADSGGFTVRNSNDLAAGLKRIADETRVYYLVGYNPTNAARDGAFRKIEVKVRGRRGLEVRARHGYYAPRDGAAPPEVRPGTDPVFQAALDSPYEWRPPAAHDALRPRTKRRSTGRACSLRRRWTSGGSISRRGTAQSLGALQYLMVTVPRDGGPFFRFDQTLELALPRRGAGGARAHVAADRARVRARLGRYRAKMVVRTRRPGGWGRSSTTSRCRT